MRPPRWLQGRSWTLLQTFRSTRTTSPLTLITYQCGSLLVSTRLSFDTFVIKPICYLRDHLNRIVFHQLLSLLVTFTFPSLLITLISAGGAVLQSSSARTELSVIMKVIKFYVKHCSLNHSNHIISLKFLRPNPSLYRFISGICALGVVGGCVLAVGLRIM